MSAASRWVRRRLGMFVSGQYALGSRSQAYSQPEVTLLPVPARFGP